VPAPVAADPELFGRPGRRTFTAQEKLRILKEADQAAGTGEIGALHSRRWLSQPGTGSRALHIRCIIYIASLATEIKRVEIVWIWLESLLDPPKQIRVYDEVPFESNQVSVAFFNNRLGIRRVEPSRGQDPSHTSTRSQFGSRNSIYSI
jgi:hypothetical protein